MNESAGGARHGSCKSLLYPSHSLGDPDFVTIYIQPSREKVTKRLPPESVPADPSKWSQASQRSVSAEWTTEYTSYRYTCWRCRVSAVFTAADQQYTYEVKKAPIDQKRVLCESCWVRSNAISVELTECERMWAASKPLLRIDRRFLERWMRLLVEAEEYSAYKADIARKNMLSKLLRELLARPSAGAAPCRDADPDRDGGGLGDSCAS